MAITELIQADHQVHDYMSILESLSQNETSLLLFTVAVIKFLTVCYVT